MTRLKRMGRQRIKNTRIEGKKERKEKGKKVEILKVENG